MTKRSILAPALLLATIFVASLGVFSRFDFWASEKSIEVREVPLVKVIDWDTIKVSYGWALVNVRIIWIDTPETFILKKGYIECYGEEATKWATSFFSWANTVTIRADKYSKNIDQYGRLVRHVYVSGEDYTKKALEAGMGFYTTWFTIDNSGALVQAENLAKKTNVGVWKDCNGTFKPIE